MNSQCAIRRYLKDPGVFRECILWEVHHSKCSVLMGVCATGLRHGWTSPTFVDTLSRLFMSFGSPQISRSGASDAAV